MKKLFLFLVPAVVLVVAIMAFVGGGGADASFDSTIPLDASEKAQIDAFYASMPDFFTFATPDDLPADLVWQDGHDEKPFADIRAVRGGTVRSYMLAWPPTMRFVGPDSNHSMRGVFLDENKMSPCDIHPITRNYIPSLAREWAVSADNRTVYFRLDPDAHYSDGVPIDADDYFYTFYFMMSPHISDPWYNNWYGEHYSNITRYDAYTISITLSEPKYDALYFGMVSPTPPRFYRVLDEHFIEKFQWRFEPTSGPWELRPENISFGKHLTVTRVENWWANDKPFYRFRHNPDRRRFTLIRDYSTAFDTFKDGGLDMFNLSLPEYWHDRSENIEPVRKGWISRAVYYNDIPRANIGLYMNRADPILADKRIRQGVHYACNWDRVIQFHFRGDFARLDDGVDGFGDFDHPTLTARPFDPEKARALFAEAGFDKAGPDGILVDSKGRRLSFSVSVSVAPYVDQLSILKEEALKAGLELNIDQQDPTTDYKKVMSKQHQMAFMGWGVTGRFPHFWEHYHSCNAYDAEGKIVENTNNVTSTADPELDALIDRYEVSENKDEMVALAHQIEEFLYDEASFVPGYKMPFYRIGFWSWLRFPEGFDVPLSEGPGMYGLYWIDEAERTRIQEAKARGEDLGRRDIIRGMVPDSK
jgi:microcin C transport system substrate-binding protein